MDDLKTMTGAEQTLFARAVRACEFLLYVDPLDVPSGVTTPGSASGAWPENAIGYARMLFVWNGEDPGPWRMKIFLHDSTHKILALAGEHDPRRFPVAPYRVSEAYDAGSLPISSAVMTRTVNELRDRAILAKDATIARRASAESSASGALATFYASYV